MFGFLDKIHKLSILLLMCGPCDRGPCGRDAAVVSGRRVLVGRQIGVELVRRGVVVGRCSGGRCRCGRSRSSCRRHLLVAGQIKKKSFINCF